MSRLQEESCARTRALRLAALALSSFVCLAAGELAVRSYLFIHPPRLRPDERCGWKCVESYASRTRSTDAAGHSHEIRYTTNALGFRTFGDLASRRPRILVVGDSFTQAVAVSDDETYHALLREPLNAEVFAYGAGGYGSLQELFVLEDSIDRIRPALVLWQFCTNDVINNDEALERASRIDNNALRRPYLTPAGITYAIPKPCAWLRALSDHSKLLLAALFTWDRIESRRADTVERAIAREGAQHEGFRRSVATTEAILRRVRSRCGTTPVVAFCADDREPYRGAFREIARRQGIGWIDGVPEALRAVEMSGVCVRSGDRAHWNEVGHRVCAAALVPKLRPLLGSRATLVLRMRAE